MFKKNNLRSRAATLLALITLLTVFIVGIENQSSANAGTEDMLTNTYWKLIELDGQPVLLGVKQRELHMVLTSEGNKVSGFSGCNRFMGGYEQSEDQLQFGQLASTKMACMEGMEQEKLFLGVLARAKRFNISGDSLAIYGDEEQLILRFESVYLK